MAAFNNQIFYLFYVSFFLIKPNEIIHIKLGTYISSIRKIPLYIHSEYLKKQIYYWEYYLY